MTVEREYTLEGLRPVPNRMDLTFTRFYAMARKYPRNTAVVFLGLRISYAELAGMIDRFASALANLGVGPGHKVMLYLGNCPQWLIANFAIQRVGAAVVPVSPIYTSHELEYLLKDSGTTTVICQDTNFGYVHEASKVSPVQNVIVTNLTELLPLWKVWLGHLLDRIPKGSVPKGLHIHHFKALMDQAKNPPPCVDIDPWNDLAHIMYTGGTTGFPKGVPGNHATEVGYIGDLTATILADNVREGADSVIMVNPLYHIMAKGFSIGVALNQGATLILMPMPHVDAILREIERHKVRWLLGVPTLYRMILESDRADQYKLDSLAYCYCGGDVLPNEVFARWKERTGAEIRQVYGATEVGHVAYTRPDAVPKPDVIGHPLPSYRCRITDPVTGEAVGQGEVGELWVTSDFNLKCYWNKPEETERSFVRVGEEIYYKMGDFVTMDPDGQLRFVERTADVIKHKGYRVSASEIEAVLQDHPAVIGACAVGIEDAAVGERIKAIVVLKHDAKGVSGNDLKRWCKDRLASYKVPQYIEFRDMLPKSKVGKLLRRSIRDEERRKMSGGKKE